MDIATNKLKPPSGVKQWLVDIVQPDEQYALKQYQNKALKIIKDVHERGKLPILVGGTGLYIDAVTENWQIPQAVAPRNLRRQLENDLKEKGLAALASRLRHLDPKSSKVIDINNPRRVIRALEVAISTGSSFVKARKKGPIRFNVLKIGLAVDRQILRERLQHRVAKMVRRGLIAETRILLKKYDSTLPSMSSIGYGEATAILKGDISKKEMVDQILMRSMQYARRQMTWWKRDKKIIWCHNQSMAAYLAQTWIKHNYLK